MAKSVFSCNNSQVSILLWQLAGDYLLKDADTRGVFALDNFGRRQDSLNSRKALHRYTELTHLSHGNKHRHMQFKKNEVAWK